MVSFQALAGRPGITAARAQQPAIDLMALERRGDPALVETLGVHKMRPAGLAGINL
jgi:hypothetical protein